MGTPGVITEQAYPAGQLGFKPLTEAEKSQLEKQMKDTANPKK